MINKFRKKPVVIEAIQWNGLNYAEIVQFMGYQVQKYGCCDLRIATTEGAMNAIKGDWIIKGVKGEFYPCKPDIFAATYEPV